LKDAEKALEQLKERLVNKTKGIVPIETGVKVGNFFGELKTVCETIKPYTVVMGSQGTTAAERLFFGGHAIYAMKHLMWPLITVSPQAKFSSIKKIGLACDFHLAIDAIPVSEIKRLVKDFDAELHILNIGKEEVFDPDIVFESVELKDLLADLKHEVYFISNENTDQGILDFVENKHIDLLIVLPKRHDLLDKIMHRSHTKQLVLHSHVPVMALHE
jgi:nucleotide-binding universal stress UspA family protein